jgi:hypothetical protein
MKGRDADHRFGNLSGNLSGPEDLSYIIAFR